MDRMPRALDHLVIAFHDLDAAAERYRRLGFQVGSRNRHPWGTENHIVQLDGAFLELVGRGEGFARPAPKDPVFPFAGFLDDFLREREGLAMMVLRTNDAEADRRTFAERGIGDRPRFDFARRGRRGGRDVDVAFSLAFAHAAAWPQTGFFVSQQRFPENFWDKAAQVHANGATAVVELAFAHPSPESAAGFLSAFVDAPPQASEGGLRFAMDGTDLTLSASAPAGMRAARVAVGGGASIWID
jgi:hypothetical protein